ncbi:MAG: hypothetical protein KGO50_17460, partial [Myxococcales bacterium]|nr:hypothetical protein [Myxococcales bacterium]
LEAWRSSPHDSTTIKRIAEHQRWITDWARWKTMQAQRPSVADSARPVLSPVANALRERRAGVSIPEFLARQLSVELMVPAIEVLQSVVDSYCVTELTPS